MYVHTISKLADTYLAIILSYILFPNDTKPILCTVQSEITFDMNDTTYNHQHYTASCTVTANPRKNLYIYTQGCDFQYNTLQIDEFTTKAIITIYNITSECRKITCATNLFQKSRTVGKEVI